jgi:hypothetical protein
MFAVQSLKQPSESSHTGHQEVDDVVVRSEQLRQTLPKNLIAHLSRAGSLVAVEVPVGVLDRQPTKGSTRGRRLWPRRDRKLEGETRSTQFR